VLIVVHDSCSGCLERKPVLKLTDGPHRGEYFCAGCIHESRHLRRPLIDVFAGIVLFLSFLVLAVIGGMAFTRWMWAWK
jgi:hypothetical protein